jgi:hypothetical protein
MTNGSRWLAGAAALMVIAVSVILAVRSCPSARPPPPADFRVEAPTLESPDMDLELVLVQGVSNPRSTSWSCRFLCRERDGCRAEIRATIEYRSGGDSRSLTLTKRLYVDRDKSFWLGREQRPPVVVDRVERVIVEVVTPYDPAAPMPTPMM